ncbi:response regulator transcription factor [Tsuneonella sp. YG55]|uniref:Response regulator transcription factor n=1 Tax=Tsuneonella litorea TaxID=2976475 RepID=A0A9X2W333_9SPHN|nr:response regulator transcription factor [Tsuneonella litorea]MCT2558911.1 response regulator transcription factor [Tsuneonella litorea]
MKILIADDHPLIRSGVSSVLALGGYPDVISAADGEAALAAIGEHAPDIAILDIRMPQASGIDVLRALHESASPVRVVLLTADIMDEQLLDALRYGVCGILFKDGAEDRLIECIGQVSAGQRYIDRELTERALSASLRSPRDSLTGLTPRERELAGLVAKGLRNREIAERMAVTEGTVKVYLNTIYTKLGIGNRTALALLVTAQG